MGGLAPRSRTRCWCKQRAGHTQLGHQKPANALLRTWPNARTQCTCVGRAGRTGRRANNVGSAWEVMESVLSASFLNDSGCLYASVQTVGACWAQSSAFKEGRREKIAHRDGAPELLRQLQLMLEDLELQLQRGQLGGLGALVQPALHRAGARGRHARSGEGDKKRARPLYLEASMPGLRESQAGIRAAINCSQG